MVKVVDDGPSEAEDESCEGEKDGDGDEERDADCHILFVHLEQGRQLVCVQCHCRIKLLQENLFVCLHCYLETGSGFGLVPFYMFGQERFSGSTIYNLFMRNRVTKNHTAKN